MKKIAIDWDESELRYVLGLVKNGSLSKIIKAGSVSLNDPDDPADVQTSLRKLQSDLGLEDGAALVAIGRGKAELRDLQLPPVPDDELPDMVRMQAIRSFASAGDNAAIDFLPTETSSDGVQLIAAAVAPDELNTIRQTCAYASLDLQRVCLRPLGTVALHRHYAANQHRSKNLVLVDLLANDAEIVILQSGKVRSIRTVRMPATGSRSRALVSEIKRSLVTCGESARPDQLVLWGKKDVHQEDYDLLTSTFDFPTEVINPFDWVQNDSASSDDPLSHTGRFAPLIGLLAANQSHPELLIDFVNPRKRYEAPPNHARRALAIGIPVAIAALLAFMVFRQFSSLDSQIDTLKSENAAMQPGVDKAVASVSRTEKIDQFLDGDVNWLDEIKRLSEEMPPAEDLIVKSLNARANPRSGGGALTVVGTAQRPDVIDQFENSLRDDGHQVLGDGAKEDKDAKKYRWNFAESIAVNALHVRNGRYERILNPVSSEDAVQDEDNQDNSQGTGQDTGPETGQNNDESGEPEAQS